MGSENKHFDINKIAELAKLNLTSQEIAKFESQMEDIISHFSSLQKIDKKADTIVCTPFQQASIRTKTKPLHQERSRMSLRESAATITAVRGHLSG